MSSNNQIYLGLGAFFIAYIISRFINERGLKMLDDEEKARLVDAFSGYRIYSSLAIVVVVAVFLLAGQFISGSSWWAAFPLILLSVLFVLTFLSFKKLRSLNLPRAFINNHFFSLSVQYLGIFILFAAFFFGGF
ncbi:MAG: hypothetical protein R2747_08455 [Pyrinomonadaceae bacterium]